MKNDKQIQLYLGDSKEVLKQLEDNSVDLICTDPPYQLSSITERFGKKGSAPAKYGKDGAYQRASKGFMGKKWDVLPPVELWKECLRVLKPGAFAFVMTTPRQDSLCQILMDLSKAGFCMGFSSIYWTYATGMPKASNMGKMVDKRLGKKRKKIRKKYTGKDFSDEALVKQGSMMQSQHTEERKDIYETKGNSPLEGSYAGFQPKPAVEIIIVAMKPLSEKTYIDQALKNGKGITWLDNCKIPSGTEHFRGKVNCSVTNDTGEFKEKSGFSGKKKIIKATDDPKGRFPANLLVSNDSLNDGKERKVGKLSPGMGKGYHKDKGTSFGTGCNPLKNYGNDKGSYSRYFDLDAWWSERINKLPESVKKVFPFLICPKPSKREKNKGCEKLEEKIGGGMKGTENKSLKTGSGNERNNKMKNNHPTVKPIKLMSYLITLGSREGDVVLDPFAGSCTTGIACKLLNRKFIGIEMNKEYLDIGMARIKGHSNDKKEN